MADREPKVHYDRGGRPRCGRAGQVALTGDPAAATCGRCRGMLDGTFGTGRRRPGVRPHGTLAAVRRHYRHGERNLRDACPPCWQAQSRANADNYRTAGGPRG